MFIRVAAAAALILLFGYGVIKAWPLLSGPSIVLVSPAKDATSTDGFVTVSGAAKHTGTLTLDGGPLLIDEHGRFNQTLLLPAGGAILTLTARDRFGRTSTLTRSVYVP